MHVLSIKNDFENNEKMMCEHLTFISISYNFSHIFLVTDVDPAFPYRDVSLKRGIDPKESYELIEEIGR